MKKTVNEINCKWSPWILLFGLSLLSACEPKVSLPSTVQFSVGLMNMREGGESTIALTLDREASQPGVLKLSIQTEATYNQHFATDPVIDEDILTLTVQPGQKKIEFKVSAIDNALFEGSKFIIFNLVPTSQDLIIGVLNSMTLVIGDDEGPSLANFEVNAATVSEKSEEGIVIQIPLSAQAKGEGTITLKINPGLAVYGLHFKTNPIATNNEIKFFVEKNATSVRVVLTPMDNNLFTDNLSISFSIVEVSGVVQKGNNLNCSLIIDDDEEPSVADFESNGGTIEEKQSLGIMVPITFSNPAKGTGKIKITISTSAVYGLQYTTNPVAENNTIVLEVGANESSASFKVLPLHDFTVTGNLEINFSISSVEGVVWKGSKLNYSLTIINEDVAAKVNFNQPSGALNENNALGIVIDLPFSGPAPGGGIITITFTSVGLAYGSHFVTEPTSLNQSINLLFDKNQTKVSFKVIPINNSQCLDINSENLIKWKISTITGGAIEKGENLEHDLSLIDDEESTIVSFAASSGILNENNGTGITVSLNFSRPTNTNGTLHFSTNWYDHQNKLTTLPAYDYDCYYYCYDPELVITQGMTSASFNVLPVNNTINEADYNSNFKIYATSGNGCLQTETASSYLLAIVDDD